MAERVTAAADLGPVSCLADLGVVFQGEEEDFQAVVSADFPEAEEAAVAAARAEVGREIRV